jgi:hypothetical protein
VLSFAPVQKTGMYSCVIRSHCLRYSASHGTLHITERPSWQRQPHTSDACTVAKEFTLEEIVAGRGPRIPHICAKAKEFNVVFAHILDEMQGTIDMMSQRRGSAKRIVDNTVCETPFADYKFGCYSAAEVIMTDSYVARISEACHHSDFTALDTLLSGDEEDPVAKKQKREIPSC